ncbi:hypothetical protein ACQEVS_23415 [Streptomyces sp. CA-181903]|uniref:hypothetical protein n=1 Tax=Streptomyces sp. CA-181903 TaxID=3240055 RepID=UPI003D93D455
MHTSSTLDASITMTTERPVPRWAVGAARLLPLFALPVCLWRLPFGFGYQMGLDLAPSPLGVVGGVAYVGTLSLLTELAAFACRGLVSPWGETLPHWVPRLGGRRVPPVAVLVPATAFSLLMLFLLAEWTVCTFHIAGFTDAPWTNRWWRLLASVVSGLFVCSWGLLVPALTYAFWRRRYR